MERRGIAWQMVPYGMSMVQVVSGRGMGSRAEFREKEAKKTLTALIVIDHLGEVADIVRFNPTELFVPRARFLLPWEQVQPPLPLQLRVRLPIMWHRNQLRPEAGQVGSNRFEPRWDAAGCDAT